MSFIASWRNAESLHQEQHARTSACQHFPASAALRTGATLSAPGMSCFCKTRAQETAPVRQEAARHTRLALLAVGSPPNIPALFPAASARQPAGPARLPALLAEKGHVPVLLAAATAAAAAAAAVVDYLAGLQARSAAGPLAQMEHGAGLPGGQLLLHLAWRALARRLHAHHTHHMLWCCLDKNGQLF